MNEAHLHLIIVHIPVVLTPTAALLLALGMKRGQSAIYSVGLYLLVTSALFCVPAFLLGEGAEELVEHLPGISEHLIEEHEEVAETAMWLSVATGLLSLVALALQSRAPRLVQLGLKVILIVSVVTGGALSYTAYEGGKIRHPEAYSAATPDQGAEHDHKDD